MMKQTSFAVAVVLLTASAARGDDWAVRRSPFNPQVVGRYKALLKKRPNDGYALARLVKLYRQHRSVAKLISEYRALARAKPQVFAFQVILGHLYRRSGKLDQAVEAYERARKLRPRSSSVPAALAALYRKQGKRDEASASYRQALRLSKSKREKKRYLRALANMALAGRDLKAARGFFKQLVELEPRNVFLRIELAQALGRSGNHQEAIREYHQILKRTRDSGTRADILKQIGEQQDKLGKSDEAVATYRRAMALAARGHWIRRELTERIITIYREKKEDLKSLIAHYEQHWKRKGHFEYQVLGRLYDETGDEARALKAYRLALKKSRHAIDTRLRLIALLERSGRDKEVISEYRKLAQIAPGEPRYQVDLAKRLYRAGDQAAAVDVLERCGRRFPSDASAHSAIADLYARWGEQRRALREAQILVRIEPRDESHLVNLGEQYFLRGQKRKAIETWKRLLTAIPQRHKAYAKLAALYGQHDMTKLAISLYRKAIKLSPKTLTHRRSLAVLLEQKRRTSEALKAWHKVLDLAGKAGQRQTQREARTHIIAILHRTYQLRHRIRSYRLLFDSNGDPDAGFFLAEAYLKQRDFEQAEKVYRKLVELHPRNIEALTALEAVYRRQRKLADAVKLLKRLAKLQPANARDYYQRIANLQLQLYNDKEALIYAHKAVALSGQDASAYQRLGQLYERKEDFAAAVAAYRKALKLNPGLFGVHFSLARLQTRQGNYDEAERLYRRVLKTARAPEVLRKAFGLGVDLSAYLGRMEELEKDIHPLAVTAHANAEVYRQILVDIYRRRVPPLMYQARHGASKTRAAARRALHRIGVRGMAPLLEQLATSGRASAARQQLIRLLGYLGNPNAVLPLLRLAEREPEEQPVVIYGKHTYGRSSPYASYRRVETQVNQRVEAAVAVGRLADERAVPGLVRLLRNPEGSLREAAAWALSRIRNRRVARALFAALGDRRSTVQMMACVGLGIQGTRELRPVLEEVMLDPAREARVRAACAWGVGALGDARATKTLLRVLRTGDDELQRCAAWSLGALAEQQAVAPLVRSLWNKRPDVRKAVVWALVRIAGGKPLQIERTADVVVKGGRIDAEQLIRRLTVGVDDLSGRELAKRLPALIRSHAGAITDGLKTALGRHRDIILRVLHDLDHAPSHATLGPLTSGMQLLDRDARSEMRRAVEEVVKQIAPAIEPLFLHKDKIIRQRAVSVYAKVGQARVGQQLRQVARNDRSWQVRAAALDALAVAHRRGRVARRVVLELTRRSLSSKHWREREAAVRLLGTLGHSSAVPQLRRALTDRNGFVREAVAEALASAGGNAAVAALTAALEDDVPHVRAAACRGLGKLAARSARKAIGKLRDDPSPMVRKAATRALRRLGVD